MGNQLLKVKAEETILRPGESYEKEFDLSDYSPEKRYELYYTGESQFGYLWRTEPDYEHFFMLIEDALDAKNAVRSRYCLDYSEKKVFPYVKRTMRKLFWPPRIMDTSIVNYTDEWRLGIYAKAEDLVMGEGGYLKLIVETWENIDPVLTAKAPDKRYEIDVPTGTYGWQKLEKTVTIPMEGTSCAIVTLEGSGYCGKVWVECPELVSADGYNVLPDFGTEVLNQEKFGWFGCNVSKKEWPRFRIGVNGKTFFDDEAFDGSHRFSDFHFAIPAELLKKGKNKLNIRFTSDYHDAAPFRIGDVRLISTVGGAFDIIYCPEIARVNADIPVLIETYRDDVTIAFSAEEDLVCTSGLTAKTAGLHVVHLKATAPVNHLAFTLSCGKDERKGEIVQVCEHLPDGVITGTGDTIQSNFDTKEAVVHFIKWYFSSKIGNLMTIRPAYRWGGTRTVNDEAWKQLTDVLNEIGCIYDLMTDGRDLPGMDKNPSPELLDGKNFLGVQLHERDGQLTYWRRNPYENFTTQDVFYDLVLKFARETPRTNFIPYSPLNLKSADGKPYLRRDLNLGADSEKLTKGIIREMQDMKSFSTRHTGPTMFFKYFLQAGYDWVGAETMYSSTEPMLSFLRGACKGYGKDSFGIHAALQWSSRPHNNPGRYRRYRLALYVPYLLGTTELNTEEGMIRLECGYFDFDRYSEACLEHLKQQQDFFRYVSSHRRTGRFYTPFAFLHGRYDGYVGFGGAARAWGMPYAPCWDSEYSWNLLNVFYPNSSINCGLRGTGYCIDQPTGCYSQTPYGQVDAVPVETARYEDYKLLSFAGYNKAEKADFDKIYAHVRKGCTLILGLPHLSDTTDIDTMRSYRHHLAPEAIAPLPIRVGEIAEDQIGGKTIRTAALTLTDPAAKVIRTTDSGKPLVVELPLGNGTVLLVNALEYPAREEVRPIYEELLRENADRIAKEEPEWIECDDTSEFSVFCQEDGSRQFYLLALDWFREPGQLHVAKLRVGNERYDVSYPFGRMLKIIVKNGIALWADSETVEFLSVEGRKATVQGCGNVRLFVAEKGSVKEIALDFSKQAVTEIAF